mmetsp:Transcript_25903/g.48644  ORF Transcript_25903/g.48644 Transcript_25903/m.48644 type:complete len:253 (-) Transcript_25903:491-1249(-)
MTDHSGPAARNHKCLLPPLPLTTHNLTCARLPLHFASNTTLRGCPSAKRRMLVAVISIRLRRASTVLYATCGIITAWSAGTFRMGSSLGMGSVAKTSRPARKRRWLRSSAKTGWSQTPPRATLISTASGRRRSNRARPMMPCVSALSATCSDTMSDFSKSSSIDTCLPRASKAGLGRRDHPRISLGPNALNSSAVLMPMSPRPTMPTTLSLISMPPAEWAHPPARRVLSEAGISLYTAKAKPTESSATESVE